MTDNDIIKALDILDKFEFFGGQRAGRLLWFDKPADIQEKDIDGFNRDIDFLKAFIDRQKAEIEALELINSTYEVETKRVRDIAIKEVVEKIKGIDLYQCIEEYYENAEICYEVRQDWFCEQIDNLVKEKTEGEDD